MYDSFNYENIKGVVPIYHFSCIFPERLECPILLFFVAFRSKKNTTPRVTCAVFQGKDRMNMFLERLNWIRNRTFFIYHVKVPYSAIKIRKWRTFTFHFGNRKGNLWKYIYFNTGVNCVHPDLGFQTKIAFTCFSLPSYGLNSV